jgi:hypothetical protein
MSKIKVEVEVSEHSYKLGQGLGVLVKNAQEAVADGFQFGTDVPVIVAQSLPTIMEAVKNISEVGMESKEDLTAFLKAWMLAGTDIAGLFVKKEA